MITKIKLSCLLRLSLALLPLTPALPSLHASSHMDAPLVTLDPAANTTDVYAFVTSRAGTKYLSVALSVYPHEEPGVGPNRYGFDDNVLYQIFLSKGADLAGGADSVAYQFKFTTTYKTQDTILQSYVGVVAANADASQNLTQTYTVTKVVGAASTSLGMGTVPPNNQGVATPKYNKSDNGSNLAKDGVADETQLDPYTRGAISSLAGGYRSWAGQREDGFYGDINSIFDLLSLKSGSANMFDSQGGFNVHTVVLEIPISDLGGDQQVVGVYATTSRRATSVLTDGASSAGTTLSGNWVQVGRQGNPLFCEALVALKDKDLYNRTKPTSDMALFKKYAETPELAALINAIVFGGKKTAPETGRADLVGIFIPDLIKVDLSTDAARLKGGNQDDAGYSRLSVFGGDALTSKVQAGFPGFPPGTIAGGWPNGRRFGDDVIDIAVTAVISDLRTNPLTIRSADGIDNVSGNDAIYNKVFPYAATPHNGRNYSHNPVAGVAPLVNISARGAIGTGDNVLIGGFIIRGTTPVQIMVRATGPSLTALGVAGALPDTVLELFQGSTMIASNDDWKSTQQTQIQATGYPPTNDKESAILVTLSPGLYSTIVRGKAGATGVGLVEALLMP
ncbi:MAG: DUF4331 domain-containing protein [Opitutus sp.]